MRIGTSKPRSASGHFHALRQRPDGVLFLESAPLWTRALVGTLVGVLGGFFVWNGLVGVLGGALVGVLGLAIGGAIWWIFGRSLWRSHGTSVDPARRQVEVRQSPSGKARTVATLRFDQIRAVQVSSQDTGPYAMSSVFVETDDLQRHQILSHWERWRAEFAAARLARAIGTAAVDENGAALRTVDPATASEEDAKPPLPFVVKALWVVGMLMALGLGTGAAIVAIAAISTVSPQQDPPLLLGAAGLVVEPDGEIFILSNATNMVTRHGPDGRLLEPVQVSPPGKGSYDLCLDDDGVATLSLSPSGRSWHVLPGGLKALEARKVCRRTARQAVTAQGEFRLARWPNRVEQMDAQGRVTVLIRNHWGWSLVDVPFPLGLYFALGLALMGLALVLKNVLAAPQTTPDPAGPRR
mgnify:CR=1 FL=1